MRVIHANKNGNLAAKNARTRALIFNLISSVSSRATAHYRSKKCNFFAGKENKSKNVALRAENRADKDDNNLKLSDVSYRSWRLGSLYENDGRSFSYSLATEEEGETILFLPSCSSSDRRRRSERRDPTMRNNDAACAGPISENVESHRNSSNSAGAQSLENLECSSTLVLQLFPFSSRCCIPARARYPFIRPCKNCRI
jgi:hypothetical protein